MKSLNYPKIFKAEEEWFIDTVIYELFEYDTFEDCVLEVKARITDDIEYSSSKYSQMANYLGISKGNEVDFWDELLNYFKKIADKNKREIAYRGIENIFYINLDNVDDVKREIADKAIQEIINNGDLQEIYKRLESVFD